MANVNLSDNSNNLLMRHMVCSHVLTSRFFTIDDPRMFEYNLPASESYDGQEPVTTLSWDFRSPLQYSKMYEYRWLADCIEYWFGPNRYGQTAIDIGYDASRPSFLMLAEQNFSRVDVFDSLPTHSAVQINYLSNLHYIQGDILCELPDNYDCVVCLSLFEQPLTLSCQLHALKNLCEAVNPGGALIATVKIPPANPHVYNQYLQEQGLDIISIDIAEPRRVTVTDSCGHPDEHGKTYLYRLFATRSH